MEDSRFFYWQEGQEVQGPFTHAELQQLFDQQVIGSATQLCPEGGAEWQPLNPSHFVQAPVPAPAPAIPPPAPVAQPPPVKSRVVKEASEDSTFQFVMKILCRVLIVGGAILMVWIAPARPDKYDGAAGISYSLGGFAAGLIMLGLLPWLVTLMLPRRFRLPVRCALIVGFLGLVAVGTLIKKHPEGLIERDLGATGAEMEKLAATEAAAQTAAGTFEPSHFTTLEQLKAQRALIAKVREARLAETEYLGNYDVHCRNLVANKGYDPEAVSKMIQIFREHAHIGDVQAICQLKLKISDDLLALADYLDKKWGHWTVTNGQMTFDTGPDAAEWNSLIVPLQVDMKELSGMKNPFAPPPDPAEAPHGGGETEKASGA